jgi:hypothetical protein
MRVTVSSNIPGPPLSLFQELHEITPQNVNPLKHTGNHQ